MRIVGIDVGSRTVKRVVLEDGRVVDRAVLPTTHDPLAVCAQLLPDRGWDRMVATGYGRGLVHSRWGAETLTEIRAVAIGARVLFPTAEVVLDVGGQDTKVIRIRRDGSVRKFEMNDAVPLGRDGSWRSWPRPCATAWRSSWRLPWRPPMRNPSMPCVPCSRNLK